MRAAGWFSISSVAVVALVGGAASCTKAQDPPRAPPPAPVALSLATAVETPTPELLVLTGLVKADQRSEITAETQGTVVAVMVERGQRVTVGEPLVRLDVHTATLSAREARANLRAARAQRKLATRECKRAREMLAKGAITPREYEGESARCASALQQLSVAAARSQMSVKSVAAGLVRAPFAGLVGERKVAPGEWVAPGRPLLTLVDDDPLTIELAVPESAVRAMTSGQEVRVTAAAYPDESYVATVTRIGAEIGTNRSLVVEATLEAGSKLLPGMFAEARVVIGSKQLPVLPESAVVKRGKTWHTFVAVEGELEERIVQLGPRPRAGHVSIVKGVTKGERVVASVTREVVDGLRVVE